MGAQLVVLRDVDESCEYQRVSWEQESSFQKPIAETHSIYGTRMDGGYDEFILTHHSSDSGREAWVIPILCCTYDGTNTTLK